MLLSYGLGLHQEADAAKAALGSALNGGRGTQDLQRKDGCSAFTDAVIVALSGKSA
jgi:isocitrate/isopropylmalate dehydrogenase